MKSRLAQIILFVVLAGVWQRGLAQLPSSPTLATTNVPEASQYGVLYELSIPATANYSTLASVIYSVNNSGLTLNYNRVAYFLQLDNKWVWVSMNKFNTTNAQLGIPYANSGIIFQQTVTGMNVYSSAGAGVTNTTGITGNIEIWPDCYNTGVGLGGIGGNGSNYDFNDTRNASTNCYGSFQVHNYGASQTIFAMNCFMGGTGIDLGIGNNSGNANPDWTFMYNASTYTTTRKLYILVQKGISINTQPSTTAVNACLNGTLSPLTVSATAINGTITNYQWYSTSTATNSGGTLVATNTTSASTNSYTPATSVAGTKYYYCVVNGSGGAVSTSSVSGAITVGNPTIVVAGSGTICEGSSISLTASGAGSAGTYVWSTGATTSVAVLSPTTTNTYSVSGTTSLGCVSSSTLVTVTVNPKPIISVSGGSICVGSSFVFSPSGAATYTYSGGTATVSPVITTNYTISGTSSAGCVGTNTDVSITVNPLPVLSITGAASICAGQTTSLTASGASSYTWSSGSNQTVVAINPANTTTYSVTGTSSFGCLSASAAQKTVTVYALPTLAIASSNTVCSGASIVLTASGANSYTWNSGATTASIAQSPVTNTSYSVSGTSVNGCVSASAAVKSVTVINLPVLSISGTTVLCAGNTSSLTVTGASTYTWNTGSNATLIAVSPSVSSNYSVTGSTAEGCISSAASVVQVSVNPIPVVNIVGSSTACAGNTVTFTANGAATYTWNTASTSSSISVSPTVTSNYSVIGSSSAGCTNTLAVVKTLSIYNNPTLAITGANTVCAGSGITLSASGAATYTWNTGANTSALTMTPSVSGGYTVTGTSAQGCTNVIAAVKSVSVISLPVLSVTGPSMICTGNSAILNASGASTYTWNNSTTNASLSVSPSVTTNYSVTGRNAEGCLSLAPAVVTVVVNALPVLTVSGNATLCAGSSATLTASGANTYTWNTTSNLSNIVVSPTTTTTYSVSGTSTAGCVSSVSAVKTITVFAEPVIFIAGSNTLCEGDNTTLTASGAASYTWSNGSFLNSIIVTPAINTTYSVSGQSINGCSNSTAAVVTLTVYSKPVISIAGNTAICAGETLNLVASGADTYTWNTSAQGSVQNFSPGTSTVYSASGTNSLGCVSSNAATHSVLVNALPILSVTASSTQVCAGESATLEASGAMSYTWTNFSNTNSIVITPVTTGNYTLSGTDANGCEGLAVVTTVSVNALPIVGITGTTSVCEGDVLVLTATGAVAYSWSGIGTSATVAVSPVASTVYTVVGTSAEGCNQIATHTVAVNALPVLTVTGSSGICTGQSATLIVTGANTYSWSTGAQSNSIVTSPGSNTTYTVTGIDALGCTNTATQLVSVAASLSVTITGPSVICEGELVNLNASGASNYVWNTTETGASISPSPSTTTTYSVLGTSGSCSNIAFATVSVNVNPILNITNSNAICLGDSTVLSVSGADTYTWSTGGNTASVQVTPLSTTVYTAAGQFINGCSATISTTVQVNPLPVLVIAGDSSLCAGKTLVLSAGGAQTYTWSNGSNSATVGISPQTSTSIAVFGTDTNGCTANSVAKTITVNPSPVISILSSATEICAGDSVTLSVSGADSYLWDNNSQDTLLVVYPGASSTYSVAGTNTFNCESEAQITITVNPVPVITIAAPAQICKTESTKLVATGADSYTWNTGTVSDTLLASPLTDTVFSIDGENVYGCVSSTSVEVKVSDCVGLSAIEDNYNCRIYPNPGSGRFMVESSNIDFKTIVISNVLGQIIYSTSVYGTTEVDLSSFANGLYSLTILQNGESVYQKTIIKQ